MVGNQLPILLIDFRASSRSTTSRWESVTNPLDRLPGLSVSIAIELGISYQSS